MPPSSAFGAFVDVDMNAAGTTIGFVVPSISRSAPVSSSRRPNMFSTTEVRKSRNRVSKTVIAAFAGTFASSLTFSGQYSVHSLSAGHSDRCSLRTCSYASSNAPSTSTGAGAAPATLISVRLHTQPGSMAQPKWPSRKTEFLERGVGDSVHRPAAVAPTRKQPVY